MSEQYLTIEHLSTKDLARIFSKIHVNHEHPYKGSYCWEWQGCLSTNGYAKLKWQTRSEFAHRILYAWLVAPLIHARFLVELDHLCRNRRCVNPAHLELVSRRENLRRGETVMSVNLNKTHCKRGHELAGNNIDQSKLPYRICLLCRQILARSFRDSPKYQAKLADKDYRTKLRERSRYLHRQRKLRKNGDGSTKSRMKIQTEATSPRPRSFLSRIPESDDSDE